MLRLLALLCLLASSAPAAEVRSVRVSAFDGSGRPMSAQDLLRYMAPAPYEESGVTPAESGLYATDLEGNTVGGRPWWSRQGSDIVWQWTGPEHVRFTLPWPIAKDGFSTVTLDGNGAGYRDAQEILLNEEIAATAYRMMKDALKERTTLWQPPYKPSRDVDRMLERVMRLTADAHAAKTPRKRAARFDEALTAVSQAWQQILFEHGRQVVLDPEFGKRLRWGLSLDETLVERIDEYERVASVVADTGADWIRLVFRADPKDFTFSKESSFSLYDDLVKRLTSKKLEIMGSVLDSLLWPKGLTPEEYAQRSRNLAAHFKDSIRSWEVASEPNGSWLGDPKSPLPPETVLLAVQKAVVEVKRVDRGLETVATLNWSEGTAKDDFHPLPAWLRWATARGFGAGIDVIGVNLYPHRHPVGIAFDPMFREVKKFLPGKRLMVGGVSFGDDDKVLRGYWWLAPGNVLDARKDLLNLFLGASAAVPDGIGGGFFWATLDKMFDRKGRPTGLFKAYKDTLRTLRK
ncbi:MAG: hypothetical protein WC728_15435 [Elusimicrobiota bacterium]